MREHRQELNKFMKEVRARDPARRMVSTMTMKMKMMMLIIMIITFQVLRYDKLYMGHDVFFYNDKSGRVERLHSAMDSSQSYTRWVDVDVDIVIIPTPAAWWRACSRLTPSRRTTATGCGDPGPSTQSPAPDPSHRYRYRAVYLHLYWSLIVKLFGSELKEK